MFQRHFEEYAESSNQFKFGYPRPHFLIPLYYAFCVPLIMSFPKNTSKYSWRLKEKRASKMLPVRKVVCKYQEILYDNFPKLIHGKISHCYVRKGRNVIDAFYYYYGTISMKNIQFYCLLRFIITIFYRYRR